MLNFSAAFDNTDHGMLTVILYKIGISGSIAVVICHKASHYSKKCHKGLFWAQCCL